MRNRSKKYRINQSIECTRWLLKTLIIVVIFNVLVVQSRIVQEQRKDKMLRLCLWTQCKPSFAMKKCPVSLEVSAKRKCKMDDNGEIGFYFKCCLYDQDQSKEQNLINQRSSSNRIHPMIKKSEPLILLRQQEQQFDLVRSQKRKESFVDFRNQWKPIISSSNPYNNNRF